MIFSVYTGLKQFTTQIPLCYGFSGQMQYLFLLFSLVVSLLGHLALASDPLVFKGVENPYSFEESLRESCNSRLKGPSREVDLRRASERYMLLGFGFNPAEIDELTLDPRPAGIFSVPVPDAARLRRTLLIPTPLPSQKSREQVIFFSNGKVNRWIRLEVRQNETHAGWMWFNPFVPGALLEKGLNEKQLELTHYVRIEPSRSYPGFSVHDTYLWPVMTRAPRGHKDLEDLRFFHLPTVFWGNNVYLKNLLKHTFETLNQHERKVLVMGAGDGVETVAMAKIKKTVIHAVDINPMAVATVRMNAVSTGVDRFVETWESDLFQSVPEKYDLILFNMPFAQDIPKGKVIDDSVTGLQSSRNLHDFGGELLTRFLKELPAHLNPGGRALIMTRPDLSRYLPDELDARLLGKFGYSSGIVGVREDAQEPFSVQEIRLRSR